MLSIVQKSETDIDLYSVECFANYKPIDKPNLNLLWLKMHADLKNWNNLWGKNFGQTILTLKNENILQIHNSFWLTDQVLTNSPKFTKYSLMKQLIFLLSLLKSTNYNGFRQ